MLSSRSDEFGLVHERRDETGGTREGARFKVRSSKFSELRTSDRACLAYLALPAWLVWFIWSIWFVLFIWLIWFIWLVSFNQKTRQTRQTKRTRQTRLRGWRTFSASCGSSTPRLSAGTRRLSQFFDLSRRSSQIHARRIRPKQSIDDIVPSTHKRKKRVG